MKNKTVNVIEEAFRIELNVTTEDDVIQHIELVIDGESVNINGSSNLEKFITYRQRVFLHAQLNLIEDDEDYTEIP